MRYAYECVNEKCYVENIVVNKSINDSGKAEKCPSCDDVMKRIYSGISTMTGDGVKHAKSS